MMRCCFAADCEHSPVRNKAGWSLGWVSALDCEGWTIWIVDAHRGDGKRFVAWANEKLTAFVELEAVVRGRGEAKPRSIDMIVERARHRWQSSRNLLRNLRVEVPYRFSGRIQLIDQLTNTTESTADVAFKWGRWLHRLVKPPYACTSFGRNNVSVADTNIDRPAKAKPLYKLPVLWLMKRTADDPANPRRLRL